MHWINFALLLELAICVVAQPEGWKMTDRFYGFRYQLTGSDDVIKEIVSIADRLGCFGWVQKSVGSLLVGEARCTKLNGAHFDDAVRSIHGGSPDQLMIKVCAATFRLDGEIIPICGSRKIAVAYICAVVYQKYARH